MDKECYLLLSKAKDKAQDLTKSIAMKSRESSDELYLESLDVILLLTKLEEQMNSSELDKNISYCDNYNNNEINKVIRKIPKWKNNPGQKSSKILSAYLQMQNNNSSITKETLEKYCKNHYPEGVNFSANFPQMHNIATKNHAKVFDICNGRVQLWQPVKKFIEEVWNEQ